MTEEIVVIIDEFQLSDVNYRPVDIANCHTCFFLMFNEEHMLECLKILDHTFHRNARTLLTYVCDLYKRRDTVE